MPGFLSKILNEADASLRGRLVAIYTVLIAVNIGAWVWALITFRHYPVLLGTALLAYSFGLRHAVDADHIAAIDNVTRKLMQERKRPVAVGFFFSVGHALVLVIGTAIIAETVVTLEGSFQTFNNIGGLIGTGVSASFLFLMAVMNLAIAWSVYRTFQHVRGGGEYVEEDFDLLLNKRGLFSRLFRPLFRMISNSWQMLFIGFLFGLGFDTATEVSLLTISATEAGKGMSIWSILAFPALFTAGMALIDTTDGVLMLGAYGWAFLKPLRKLYYNLTITIVSALVALVIGGIETLGLIGTELNLAGPFWDEIGTINDNFGTIGYAIIGIFVVSWLFSTVIYRIKKYDDIEVRMADRT
ncbi:MAG TPA: HoxN/HupN/NixA family nickel/cobalt transporter [Stellaceae bacterium]|nr:HoxN/HupN/NixA family nickel/cobalt transporter [Stellaceae bacterium]